MSTELQAVLTKYVQDAITKEIDQSLRRFDLQDTVGNHVKMAVQAALTNFSFPAGSIELSALNWENYRLNANKIYGTHESFSSTGIQDTADSIQLRIENEGIVVTEIDAEHARFEKLATDHTQTDILNVNESANINGDLAIKGNVKITGTLDAASIKGISELLESKETVNINGKAVLSEGRLGNTVLESNLRSVGVLKELQVNGESLLADTLYVSPAGRIGINTDEPTHAVSMWDEEVHIVIGKQKQDSAVIGTTRAQELVLQSNNKKNIVLQSNGDVEIDNPVLNGTRFTGQDNVPGSAGNTGDICWNTRPAIGKPVGWVCLGGTQWAKFGVIE
jgi:hypothetical protein